MSARSVGHTADRPKISPRVQTLGSISVDAIYPLEVFKALTGLAGWALRQARRAHPPLRIVKVGRRSFVRGSDFAAYLDGQPARAEHSVSDA